MVMILSGFTGCGKPAEQEAPEKVENDLPEDLPEEMPEETSSEKAPSASDEKEPDEKAEPVTYRMLNEEIEGGYISDHRGLYIEAIVQ